MLVLVSVIDGSIDRIKHRRYDTDRSEQYNHRVEDISILRGYGFLHLLLSAHTLWISAIYFYIDQLSALINNCLISFLTAMSQRADTNLFQYASSSRSNMIKERC